jgi:signal transduction histidine kinase
LRAMGIESERTAPDVWAIQESTEQKLAALKPEQVEALLTISAMLSSDLDAGRILRDVLRQICSMFRADRAAIFLREKMPTPSNKSPSLSEARRQDIGRVLCVASVGLTQKYLDTITGFYEKKEFRQIQSLRRPIYIADAGHDYRLNGLRELNQHEGFKTMLTLPLSYQETLIGTLILYHDQSHNYSEQETRLLSIFASQAALAITNARLYQEAREREREAAQLADIGRIFNASLKTREVLNRVVRTAGEMLGNTALVYIIPEDSEEAVPIAFFSKAAYEGQIRIASPVKNGKAIPLGEGAIGKALQSDVPFLMTEPTEILKNMSFINVMDGVNSLLCVLLKTRGRIIGALLSYQVTYGQPLAPLHEKHLSLAQALADRAAMAIENARLYEAEKRAVRVKDEFLSLVSHELNTPVTNIKGFNQLLSKKLEDAIAKSSDSPNRAIEGLRHYTEIISGQINRLQSLITDLSRISLIETNQLELNLEQTVLLPIIQDEVDRMEKSLQAPRDSQVRHSFVIEAKRPELKANVDREAFARILQNLLSNAVKFSPQGGIIRLELAQASSNTLKLSVSDQGVGISEQDLPHVFERFYKSSQATSRANGLGLGLYISRSLAEAMNGQLHANSTEGKGSTFTLRLPRV